MLDSTENAILVRCLKTHFWRCPKKRIWGDFRNAHLCDFQEITCVWKTWFQKKTLWVIFRKTQLGRFQKKTHFGDFQENEFLRETLFFHVPGGGPDVEKVFFDGFLKFLKWTQMDQKVDHRKPMGSTYTKEVRVLHGMAFAALGLLSRPFLLSWIHHVSSNS